MIFKYCVYYITINNCISHSTIERDVEYQKPNSSPKQEGIRLFYPTFF